MKKYDAVVIGGGPAGMTAALYLLRSGVSTAMIEKLSPGGQVLITSEIENYPGFPDGLQGWELADKFSAQLDNVKYDLARLMGEVKSIEVGDKAHTIVMDEERIEAKTIILASGAKYRKLGVPGEDRLIGKGVSYCALCDGNFFRGEDVAVVGGGNSALEEALYLSRIVNKVYLIHRRDEFRGLMCYQDKCVSNSKIQMVRSAVVEEIEGEKGVESVRVSNVKTGETDHIKVAACFVFVGFEPIMDFVPDAVAKDANGVITDTEMLTNVPGIFAAGDVRSKKCRQVASAVGDGATAANSAFSYLEQLEG